jgi:hypothetical protein
MDHNRGAASSVSSPLTGKLALATEAPARRHAPQGDADGAPHPDSRVYAKKFSVGPSPRLA